MKCQNLFSGINKKISICCLLKILVRLALLSIKERNRQKKKTKKRRKKKQQQTNNTFTYSVMVEMYSLCILVIWKYI